MTMRLIIVIAFLFFGVVICGLQREIAVVNIKLKNFNESKRNDSILLSEYQNAFALYLKENPKNAIRFSQIIDSLNCKK